LLRRLLDIWLARHAEPSAAALQAAAQLKPATVVTGGSRGIGLALARRFAKAGHDVLILARGNGPLEEAAAAIERDFSVQALALAIDVTETDAPQRIDAHLAARGYYVDNLVNCAGVGLAGPFDQHGEREVMRLIDLNVTALTRLMHHVLPGMLARGRGGVMNVASLGGLAPGPYQAAYYASKAYVISLSEAIAAETAGEGVRVTALAPGPVNTAWHERAGAETALYRTLVPAASAASVARAGYLGYLFGLRVVVPGLINPFLALALKIIPHRIMVPFIAWLLRPREIWPRETRPPDA
jgi:short-subunit dehydrogenase